MVKSKSKVWIVLLVMVLAALVLVGCKNEVKEPPTPFPIHGYESVGLENISAWGDDYETFDGDLESFNTTFPIAVDLSNRLSDLLMTSEKMDELFMGHRSVDGMLYTKVRDEGFSLANDDDKEGSFMVKYFDALLSGNVASLSGILLYLHGLKEIESAIPVSGGVELSTRVEASWDPAAYGAALADSSISKNIEHVFSVYGKFAIASEFEALPAAKAAPSADFNDTTISANFAFSDVMNVIIGSSDSSDLDSEAQYYRIPSAITIEVRPFTDISIDALMNAMSEIGPGPVETMFAAIKPVFWGTTSDWCLRITRTIGNADGSTNTALSQEWKDAEVLGILGGLFTVPSLD